MRHSASRAFSTNQPSPAGIRAVLSPLERRLGNHGAIVCARRRRFWRVGSGVVTEVDGERRLGLGFAGASGQGEAAAAVEAVRALVVVMCPQVDARVTAPSGFGNDRVQHRAADALAQRSGTT
jgi:hypothetical protein